MEVTLADGSVFPQLGSIDFSEPSFAEETGTFLVRTRFDNPEGDLRPGQFVRVRLKGAIRPASILLPQRAVLQGAKGYYVWVVDSAGKAARREVEIGDWQGDGWFINHGLLPGERVVVDGAIRLSPGMDLKVADIPASFAATPGAAMATGTVDAGKPGAPGSSGTSGTAVENMISAPPDAPPGPVGARARHESPPDESLGKAAPRQTPPE